MIKVVILSFKCIQKILYPIIHLNKENINLKRYKRTL